MRWNLGWTAAAMLLAAAAAGEAKAVVVYDINWDDKTEALTNGWDFNGGGSSPITHTHGIDANGVGGSNALFHEVDAADTASGWGWWNYVNRYGIVAANVLPANSADFSFSVDVFTSGRGGADPLVVTLGSNPAGFQWSWSVPTSADGTWTTLDLSTATFTGTYDPTAELFLSFTSDNTEWGSDDDNILRIDNLIAEVVPEPASLALLGLGGLALVRRRR